MERIKTAGRVIKRHRLFFVLAAAVFTVGIIAGVYAVSESDVFDGQVAAGDHNWWDDIGDGSFCERCHQGVMADITAGPHVAPGLSDCTFCHSPGAGDHAASQTACATCHSTQAGELAGDAHAGILDDLGETTADASQTCQSCHTHVSVNVVATPQPPLELIMGG